MDTDMVALRSSEEVLSNSASKSAIVASQDIAMEIEPDTARGSAIYDSQYLPQDPLLDSGIGSGMVMAKPGAPFLRRWMDGYRNFDNISWVKSSPNIPSSMIPSNDPDATVLASHPNGWFYPEWRHRSAAWFGKWYWHIEQQYGQHMWHIRMDNETMLDPHTARTIDTSFFCAIRTLFDNIHDDGYYAMQATQNQNCTSTFMEDLVGETDAPFAAYETDYDMEDMKWVDTSGNHLHGWAPRGTEIQDLVEDNLAINSTVPTCRQFEADSFVNFPVPIDWDARVGTVSMRFQLDHTVPFDQVIQLVAFEFGDGVRDMDHKLDVNIRRSRSSLDAGREQTNPG